MRTPTSTDIKAMTDDEVMAYAVANGISPGADVAMIRVMLNRSLETPQQRYVRLHAAVYPKPGTIDHETIKYGRFGQPPTKMPCVECPLSRASVPGNLGGYTVDQYLDVLHGFADIACHLSEGFPKVLETQRSCTGVAMFRANFGVILPPSHARDAVERVGRNTELAFASDAEFAAHHGKKA